MMSYILFFLLLYFVFTLYQKSSLTWHHEDIFSLFFLSVHDFAFVIKVFNTLELIFVYGVKWGFIFCSVIKASCPIYFTGPPVLHWCYFVLITLTYMTKPIIFHIASLVCLLFLYQ